MSQQIIEGYQLSPQQKHLWSLSEGGGQMSYVAQCVILIEGTLDREILRTALRLVIERQEILRTSLNLMADMTVPLQVVNASGEPSVDELDLSDLPEPIQTARLETLLQDAARRHHKLEQPNQLSLTVVRLAPHKRVLLVSQPAMYADREGLKNFMNEQAACYAACLNHEQLPEEPIQYAALSEWQNESLEAEESKVGRDYWRTQEDSGTPLRLPFEKDAPEEAGFNPGSPLSFTISPEVVERLEGVCAPHQAALASALLASFYLLLARLCARPRLTLGVGFDGRDYDELAPALGLFARFLPVGLRLDAALPFADLLRALEAALADARRWQELYTPAPAHAPARHLPFCFEFDADPAPAVEVGGRLRFTLLRAAAYVTRFTLLLRCLRRPDGSLLAEWHYDAGRLSAAEVGRMAARWEAVLAGVGARGGQLRVGEAEVVGGEERVEILRRGRGVRRAWARGGCVHEVFAAQAGRTPGAVAVEGDGVRLSYGELEVRANQLARYLRGRGVGAEQRVGLMLGRGVEAVVGMLGIMKAGGAYVPLEGGAGRRLGQMVRGAGVRVVVSSGERKGEVEGLRGWGVAEAVYVDEEAEGIGREGREALESVVGEGNLAYVIYTSGSTGTPKGVMISHKAICNRLLWMLDKFPMTAADSVLQKTPYSFDASIWELFVPLFAGARLVMARHEGHRDSAYLVSKIRESNITTLQLVPSMLRIVLEEPGFDKCKSLRRVFCGGEALPVQLQQQFFARMNMELHNLYGPTETAIDATSWTFRPEDQPRGVIIGRPIANTEVYLLDSALNLVPIGVAGEVHVGGFNLARGYLNQPALTAERFIPNPFSDEPGERLYKTGDLARGHEDGAIEYLGRLDHQVKLRGFRIELGEIEAALGSHPQVRQVVVILREDEAEHKRLVAYVVGPTDAQLTVSELHDHLRTRLPEYMVPSAFVILPELPLLPNGKLNRQQLPMPEHVRPQLEEEYVAPRTPSEEILAGVWAQVLGLPQVGVRDNFFELGGDSILSIQIVARANQAGLKLSPKLLFRHQTIAELSTALAEASAADDLPSALAEQGLLTGLLPLTPIQHYFFEQSLADQHHFNQSLLLVARRRLQPELLQQALRALVSHHDALRLRFEGTAQGWLQRYGGAEAVEEVVVRTIDVSDSRGAERSARIEAASDETQRSLSLSEGGLVRAVLFETGEEQRLLLVAHHLVVDGVSWRIMVEDLAKGYEQLEGGAEEVTLGRKTSSYRNWGERLEEFGRGPEVREERGYWRGVEKWGGKRLAVDYPGGRNTIGSSSSVVVWLDAEATRALLQEVPKAYRTQINDVLLTALVEAFGKWGGVSQLLLDMEGHGRSDELFDDIDLTRTVGWFTSVYPVLLSLEGIAEPGAALKHVKEHLRSIPHGGIGYGILRYLSKAGDGEEAPLQPVDAEVSFNYLGQVGQGFDEESLFAGAPEPQGALQSERGERRYLLEITMAVVNGRLQTQWSYGVELHAKETIERLADNYLEALRRLIAHCQLNESQGFTPSDFSLARLGENELDQILSEVEFEGS